LPTGKRDAHGGGSSHHREGDCADDGFGAGGAEARSDSQLRPRSFDPALQRFHVGQGRACPTVGRPTSRSGQSLSTRGIDLMPTAWEGTSAIMPVLERFVVVSTSPILSTTSIPSMTLPKTQ